MSGRYHRGMSGGRTGDVRCGPVDPSRDRVASSRRVLSEVIVNGWLCGDCKSVNSPSANNCYSCWTPRRFGEAPDPATLPPGVTPEQAHAERKQQLRPSRSDARSSRRRSWVVLSLITVTVAFNALTLAYMGAKGGSLGIALTVLSGEWSTMGSLMAISIVASVLGLLAAIAWFVWFDRVLANVPPLTGKWPEVSRVMAVVWWLVPFIGPFKGTFIVGHVYGLMAVARSPGMWLLGLWGIAWIGGTLAPSVAGFFVGWLPLPLAESVHLRDLVSNLGQISYIAAGFLAVALILALEHARDARMAGVTDALADEPEVPLEARLAGRTPRTPAEAGFASSPAPWPVSSPGWSTGAPGWPDDPMAQTGPGPSTAPPWPPIATQPAPPLTSAGPVTHADPFEPPENAKRRVRDRGPVPFEPILVMGALVLLGVVGGITMAGMADPFGSVGGLIGRGATDAPTPGAPTPGAPTPGASAPGASLGTQAPLTSPGSTASPAAPPSQAVDGPTPAPSITTPPPVPTAAPDVSSSPSMAPVPTHAPADLVARRLVRTVTEEPYRGLADVDATYTDGTGETSWSVRLGRMGDREWRLQEVRRPGADAEVLEQAILVNSVWERGARTDWVQRRKTDRDQATAPMFDLTDARQLSFVGLADTDGASLYRYEWDADDDRIQRFIRALGAVSGMTIASGEVLATERGVPVRLDLSLVGQASDGGVAPSLRMSVTYSEVGSDIEVRSPRAGPPLVVRH